MPDDSQEPVIAAIAAITPALLQGLNALEFAARHLNPAQLAQLVDAIVDRAPPLEASVAQCRATEWPEHLAPVRDRLATAGEAVLEGLTGLVDAVDAPQPIAAAYRSLRGYARAAEAIYPLAGSLRPINLFFLDATARNDAELVRQLAARANPEADVGVMHSSDTPGERGGFSMYVPEYYSANREWPLVVALHGGSGNGRAFLWSWLRDVRSRGAILLSPTAVGSTWSLMEPEVDADNLARMVTFIGERWRIDRSRILMTGMSDGGTFTYVGGVRSGAPFTHYAPVAASFHPMMLTMMDEAQLRACPLYIVHGAHDWMFPAVMAQQARETFESAGAQVTYREIPDLSHTYPRDENSRILDWLHSAN
ncbi:MAG: dienelactone hydrolase family protein [Alphaproteobacteria bacterium]|nr:dienelactone hydrolase family protein [Alphaproteobacteria bacterium]MCW5739693.1 dienelactone hydrolase family protein [Alphaproteobacteria bacterium]